VRCGCNHSACALLCVSLTFLRCACIDTEQDMMLSAMPAIVRDAVLEPLSCSDLVQAIMGSCHDLMTPAVVGLGDALIGTRCVGVSWCGKIRMLL
jgi:hypothetical protein